MNLSKIHHIAIIVSDYEAAREFYVNKLGFVVIRENYRLEFKKALACCGEGVCSYFSGFSAFFFFGAILWPE